VVEVRVASSSPVPPGTAAPDPAHFATAAAMQKYQRLSFSSAISLAPRPSSAAHWTLDAAKVARSMNRSVPKSEKERGGRPLPPHLLLTIG
jgi:hypothetical protein